MSLYGDYCMERMGKFILEDERGFATYSFTGDTVYVEDVYVVPEFRKEGIGTQMTEVIAGIAKGKGYKRMITSIVPSTPGATVSMAACLAYGFKLDSSANNFIVLAKSLTD